MSYAYNPLHAAHIYLCLQKKVSQVFQLPIYPILQALKYQNQDLLTVHAAHLKRAFSNKETALQALKMKVCMYTIHEWKINDSK